MNDKIELNEKQLEQVCGGRTLTLDEIKDIIKEGLKDDAGYDDSFLVNTFSRVNVFCLSGIEGACVVRSKVSSKMKPFDDVENAIPWVLQNLYQLEHID